MSPMWGNGHKRGEPRSARSPGGAAAADFAARFERSYRALWLTAVAIVHDAALAEDVVQEAALIALGKLEQFKPDAQGSSFNAWMGQIVRYVALNARRKDRRQGPTRGHEEMEHLAFDSARPRPHLTRGQMPADQDYFDDQVVSALRELQETPRACLLLRTIEGMEYKEISHLLGIPEGTAMSHVHRARMFLRQRLAEFRRAMAPVQGPQR